MGTQRKVKLIETDLRVIGRNNGYVQLFDGREGKIHDPYLELKLGDDNSENLKEKYVDLSLIMDEVQFVKMDGVLTGERKALGEPLYNVNPNYDAVKGNFTIK